MNVVYLLDFAGKVRLCTWCLT